VHPNWLAVGVTRSNSAGSFLCVFDNPLALNAQSSCKNNVNIAGAGTTVKRMFEYKGSLYVSTFSTSESRLEIYRNPLTDSAPTVTLPLGQSQFVTGMSVAE